MKYSVRNTDNIQKMNEILSKIKESIAQQQEMIAEFERELESVVSNNCKDKYSMLSSGADAVISGIRQFAEYIHKSPATAMKIIKSNILQNNGIAYQVGNTWNFNKDSLDRLLAEDPKALHC